METMIKWKISSLLYGKYCICLRFAKYSFYQKWLFKLSLSRKKDACRFRVYRKWRNPFIIRHYDEIVNFVLNEFWSLGSVVIEAQLNAALCPVRWFAEIGLRLYYYNFLLNSIVVLYLSPGWIPIKIYFGSGLQDKLLLKKKRLHFQSLSN